MKTLTITVLAGGPSSEREVSLAGGRAVTEALAGLGHRATMRDIGPDDLSALDAEADVVFPVLHGWFGEDGQLQAILEQRGIRYVGCGPEASATAMDKCLTKRLCARADVPTAEWQLVTPDQRRAALQNWADKRVVVKPVDQGSSVDVYLVPDAIGLAEALDRLLSRYGRCLVERHIAGPELAVGVLDEQALPVIQIVPQAAFYDYQAKYMSDSTRYIVNPPLDGALLARIQQLSLTVFRTLGCRDLSRVDWLIDPATNRPCLLEVNTLPGFTSHSLLPMGAAAVGISFPQLCQRLVDLAMRR